MPDDKPATFYTDKPLCPCGSISFHADCLNAEFDQLRSQVPLGQLAFAGLVRNQQMFQNAGFSDPIPVSRELLKDDHFKTDWAESLLEQSDPIPAGADPIWQPQWWHVHGNPDGGWNPTFTVCYVAQPAGKPCFPLWQHLRNTPFHRPWER